MEFIKNDEIKKYFETLKEKAKYLSDGLEMAESMWEKPQIMLSLTNNSKNAEDVAKQLEDEVKTLKGKVQDLKLNLTALVEESGSFIEQTMVEYTRMETNLQDSLRLLKDYGYSCDSFNSSDDSNLETSVLKFNELHSEFDNDTFSNTIFESSSLPSSTPLVCRKPN